MKYLHTIEISKDIITGLNRTCNLVSVNIEWYSIQFEFSIHYLDEQGKRLNNKRVQDYPITIEINLRSYKEWYDLFCNSVFKKNNVIETLNEFIKFCDKTGFI
jgi:c-di-AMP phosphodiesterase-like protein